MKSLEDFWILSNIIFTSVKVIEHILRKKLVVEQIRVKQIKFK